MQQLITRMRLNLMSIRLRPMDSWYLSITNRLMVLLGEMSPVISRWDEFAFRSALDTSLARRSSEFLHCGHIRILGISDFEGLGLFCGKADERLSKWRFELHLLDDLLSQVLENPIIRRFISQ